MLRFIFKCIVQIFKCDFSVHAGFLDLFLVRDVVGMSWGAEVLCLYIYAFLII
jgi:hypothetical protein